MILANLRPNLRCWLVIVGCISLIACTSLSPIELGRASEQLNVGDKVEIVTKKGEKSSFTVDHISAEGISGQGYSLAYTDIKTLHKVNFNDTRTGLLTFGIIGILLLLSQASFSMQ